MMNKRQLEYVDSLYRNTYLNLYLYAKTQLNDHPLSEEAVQETFRIACQKITDLQDSINPEGWLMNTLKNVIRNMERNRMRLNNALVSSLNFNRNTPGAYEVNIDPALIFGGIVSEDDFQLLKRIALDKYSLLEAADELGISIEACKKRVQRAKAKLKENILNN